MTQIAQARQEGIGHIETVVPINWLELKRTTKNRRELSGAKRNVEVKADVKVASEEKGPQEKVHCTSCPVYDVYYTEDNMMGIAWADVVLK